MPRQRFRIIDADGHVMEPADMWARSIDPAFRDRAPRIVQDRHGRRRIATGDVLSPRYECVSTHMQEAFAMRVAESLSVYRDAEYSAASQLQVGVPRRLGARQVPASRPA